MLEVWNGSEWEDYLLTRTEGRNNDYWMNEEEGILWLRTYPRYITRTHNVRLTYRFKELTVPGDIKRACVLLTARNILQNDDQSVIFPEGSSSIAQGDKSDKWQEQAEVIIGRNREIKNATT